MNPPSHSQSSQAMSSTAANDALAAAFGDSGLSSLADLVAVVEDEEELKRQGWTANLDKERLASLSPNKPASSKASAMKTRGAAASALSKTRNAKKRTFEQLQGTPSPPKWKPIDTLSPSSPSKKRCNCKNSKCLKLYCECFGSQMYCDITCNCVGCQNRAEFEHEVKKAVHSTMERNPFAFKPKINSPKSEIAKHSKGCHCKKSSCLKRYCECFQAEVFCSENCKCVECKNFHGNEERQALLELADSSRSPPHLSHTSSSDMALIAGSRKVMNSLVQRPMLLNLCKVLLLCSMDSDNGASEAADLSDVNGNHGNELVIDQMDEGEEAASPNVVSNVYSQQERAVLLELCNFLKRAEDILQKNAEYGQSATSFPAAVSSPKTVKQTKSAETVL